MRLRPLNEVDSPVTRPRSEPTERPSFGSRRPPFTPQRPSIGSTRNDGITRQPIGDDTVGEDSQQFFEERDPEASLPPRRNDDLIGIPDVEPSLGDESSRPNRKPFVKPFRPTPEKDDLDDDYIEVVEGTFEPSLPTVPFKTDDLPFTTNVVVSGGFGGPVSASEK